MVDKLLFRKESMVLRCFSRFFQCFALFLLDPYFVRGFVQRMGSIFFWPMDIDPLGPLV